MKSNLYYSPNTDTHIAVGIPFILSDIRYSGSWLEEVSESMIAAIGLFPVITIETVPNDYWNYDRTEVVIGTERRVTWARKSQVQIDAIFRTNALAQIEDMERQQLLPRATREFMLTFMEATFTPEQLTTNYGYQAVKEFDMNIISLRSKL